jgi:hypothetical protein
MFKILIREIAIKTGCEIVIDFHNVSRDLVSEKGFITQEIDILARNVRKCLISLDIFQP